MKRILIAIAMLAFTVWLEMSTGSSGFGLPAFLLETGESNPIFELRCLRALAALTVGGALAVSGMILQAVLRNPLAEPFILGISGGAAAGAGLVMFSGLAAVCAFAVSIGIALQNIPEGAIISMPMYAEGNSRMKSFLIGSLSGVVEPIGSVAILLLAGALGVALPYLLAFAAGAMMYVVVEELIPETAQGSHTNLSTIGFAFGFVLMMVMDVMLG